MIEIWKDIEGTYGAYQISSFGRVKSVARNNYQTTEDRIKKPLRAINGYLKVCLSSHSQKSQHSIHRLVATHFLPPMEGCTQVNHIDENKENNNVSNLEWVSNTQNMNHGRVQSKIGDTKLKAIRQIDLLSLEDIKTWPSVAEALDHIQGTRAGLARAVNSGKPYKGYLWRFVTPQKGNNRMFVQEIEGQPSKVWKSFKEAREAGYDRTLIRAFIRGKISYYRGSTWREATLEEIKQHL